MFPVIERATAFYVCVLGLFQMFIAMGPEQHELKLTFVLLM